MPTAIQVWKQQLTPRLEAMAFLLREAADPDVLHALLAIDELANEVTNLRTAAVAEARRQGATWEEIGEAVGGITKQAAYERFGANGHRAMGRSLS